VPDVGRMNAATATIGSAVCAKKLQPFSQIPRAITRASERQFSGEFPNCTTIQLVVAYATAACSRGRHCQPRVVAAPAARSVISVTSGGQLKRIGTQIVPIPMFVYRVRGPIRRSPQG
jgi:hypothetical protein